jgi:S-adenosyl-L-methionine hydrolase (adenosine-forming)
MSIVTLTTDIGQQDYIVGAIKGQILSANISLQIIDISHYLSQANFPEAAYICSNAFAHFPQKTIHLVLLNFFEKKDNCLLIAEYNNQFIICADNGLLTMITENKHNNVYQFIYNPQKTFLQITAEIASVIKKISNNNQPSIFLEVYNDYQVKLPLKASIGDNWIKGHIIFIDNFENVVVNITKDVFEQYRQGRDFSIALKLGEEIVKISNSYFSVSDGDKLAWFNSAGYLELAMNKGNIAGLFGLQGFNELNYKEGKSLQNKLFFSYITIFFR